MRPIASIARILGGFFAALGNSMIPGSLVDNNGCTGRGGKPDENPAGTKLAKKAAKKSVGMPRGVTFIGTNITWPRPKKVRRHA